MGHSESERSAINKLQLRCLGKRRPETREIGQRNVLSNRLGVPRCSHHYSNLRAERKPATAAAQRTRTHWHQSWCDIILKWAFRIRIQCTERPGYEQPGGSRVVIISLLT